VKLFLRIPSKKLYPDYFDIIKTPISIHEITAKAQKNLYTPEEFQADFDLLARNARTYNDKDSFVARDAQKIYEFVRDQVKEHRAKLVKDDKNKQPNVKQELDPYDVYFEKLKTAELGCLDELIKYKRSGRVLSEMFMNEPSRNEYPEYYQVIENATSFSTICRQVVEGQAKILDTFQDLVELIFINAKKFNQEESQVYSDALTFEKLFSQKMEKLRKSLPEPEGYKEKFGVALKLRIKPQQQHQPQTLKLSLKPKEEELPKAEQKENQGGTKDDEDVPVSEDGENGEDGEDEGEEPESEGGDDDDDDEEYEEDEEEQQEEVEPEEEEEPVVEEDRRRPQGKTAADALIKSVNITSMIPVTSRYMQSKNPIPPPNLTDLFQVAIPASKTHIVQSYAFNLPPYHSTVNFTVLLNQSLHTRYYNLIVTQQGRRLAPISSSMANPWADNSKPLKDRFELRLNPGLNHIEVIIQASPPREGLPIRHTMPNPQALTAEGSEQEKFTLWLVLGK
jgi:chromatin structure-remodeling complex subunit RSC4